MNYYTPFCIAFENDNKEEVQLFLDYDRLLDLANLLKPFLDEEKSKEEADKQMSEEDGNNWEKKNNDDFAKQSWLQNDWIFSRRRKE